MSRTIRRPMPHDVESHGDRCLQSDCSRCANPAHWEDAAGERSDKYRLSEATHRKDEAADRRSQRRNHRRQVSRRVRIIVRDPKAWEAADILADAPHTEGRLSH